MRPRIEALFPTCTATDIRCRRKSVDIGSPVSLVILLPSCLRKATDLGRIAPIVSTAIGVKMRLGGRSWHFSAFLPSVCSATFPAP